MSLWVKDELRKMAEATTYISPFREYGRPMRIEGRRLGNFSYRTRRAVEIVFTIPCFVSGANLLFGWEYFGGRDNAVFAISVVILFLVMRFIGPGPGQTRSQEAHDESRLGE